MDVKDLMMRHVHDERLKGLTPTATSQARERLSAIHSGGCMNRRKSWTWQMMLPAALLSAGALLVGPPASRAQDIVGNPANGKAVYERHCLRCHGGGGHGDGPERERLIVPPADFHRFTTQTKSDEQLMTIIEFGLALSPMHGFAGRLTERERNDVLTYIRLLMRDY